MKITRISMVSGKKNTWDIDITDEQYDQFAYQGVHVQDAFPHLSADEREFILTGITPDEWEQIMAHEEDEIDFELMEDEQAF